MSPADLVNRTSHPTLGAAMLVALCTSAACGSVHGRTSPCERNTDCAPDQACVKGQCVAVEPVACGVTTCNSHQKCLFDVCYSLDCATTTCADGQVCEANACIASSCVGGRCASGPCDSSTCPTGCCQSDTCVPYASQDASRCGTSGAVCQTCSGQQLCATTTHTCCAPSCANRCAGESDGCGGSCATNQCTGCCVGNTCEPLCGGACCGASLECVGEALCCAPNSEPVAAILLQNNEWPASPSTINADAFHYFRFALDGAADVSVLLDLVTGSADLSLVVKAGSAPTNAEYEGALASSPASSGSGCLWYAFESPGDFDEAVTLSAVPAAEYFLLVHNRSTSSATFRVGYVATPR